jgi:hypothetical protein
MFWTPAPKPSDASFQATLPPGKYRITAGSGIPRARLTAAVDLEVGPGEAVNSPPLSLTSEPVLTVWLRNDDGSPLLPLKLGESRRLDLTALAGWSVPPVPIADNGAFQVPLSKLGTNRLAVYVPEPWYMKSATMGGRDALAEDIHLGAGRPLGTS